MNQLDPNAISTSALEGDVRSRCNRIIEGSQKLGVLSFMTVDGLLAANATLNYLFTYEIFLRNPLIKLNKEQEVHAAEIIKDDEGDSREERCIIKDHDNREIYSFSIQNVDQLIGDQWSADQQFV